MELCKRKSSKFASLFRMTSWYHTRCSQLVTSVIDVQGDYLPQNITVAIRDFWNFGVRYCCQEQEHCYFWASTRQLCEWFSPCVHLPVTPVSLYSRHGIIIKFTGVITIDKSDVHAKGEGQRSKVTVTEVKTQFSCFWTVTPFWWCNDAQSLMWHRRGAPCFFKVIHQISRSQWVNSVPPYVRKLHFMYEAIRTSGKCRWNIYHTSSKCRWSIYRTSRKRRGTLRIVHKVERSSPTVKVTWDKKSPILTRIGRFWTVTSVWIHQWLSNDAQSLK